MVTKRQPAAKRTKKPAKVQPQATADELFPRPDLDKGMRVTEEFLRENVEWLKDMAKR